LACAVIGCVQIMFQKAACIDLGYVNLMHCGEECTSDQGVGSHWGFGNKVWWCLVVLGIGGCPYGIGCDGDCGV
jgi:hypothetical protein